MTLKLGFLALALLAVWLVLFRSRRKASARSPKPPSPAPTELRRCARCGIYHGGEADCACGGSSMPAE